MCAAGGEAGETAIARKSCSLRQSQLLLMACMRCYESDWMVTDPVSIC